MKKQTKWLVGLVALLMIANIGLVATIWLHKDYVINSSRPRDARDYLVKTLELDEGQVKAFDSLRKVHFERMDEKKKMVQFLKEKLFHLLGENQTSEAKNKLMMDITKIIGELQEDIDREIFDHFSQLRLLLNDQQKKKFDTTIQQVLQNLGPGPEGNNAPPKDGPPTDGPRN